MKLEFPVTIITPSTNSDKLRDAIDSVASQTYGNVKHLIVMDGVKLNEFQKIEINKRSFKEIQIVELPFNTGTIGNQKFYGHRIYAGFSQLINSDYVCFLDEDNWFEPDHVETLVDTLEKDKELDLSFSLRKIYDKDKNFLIEDNCESLGNWPIWCSPPDNLQYLIDTSSFCFRKTFIEKYGPLWNSGWGGDRRFLSLVSGHAKWKCSGEYTLCYRLDGNPNSVTKEFFEQGNKFMEEKYFKKLGNLPWRK